MPRALPEARRREARWGGAATEPSRSVRVCMCGYSRAPRPALARGTGSPAAGRRERPGPGRDGAWARLGVPPPQLPLTGDRAPPFRARGSLKCPSPTGS